MTKTLATDEQALRAVLSEYGQQHVLRHWRELNAAEQAALAEQIGAIDWTEISQLVIGADEQENWEDVARRAVPPEAISISEFEQSEAYAQALSTGQRAIANHQVALVLTAGGQGTRLGFDQPKGLFEIGPVSRRSLFQILIEHALARAQKHGGCIPIYIMTSPQTDQATREFLTAHRNFGCRDEDLHVFCQGTMPAVDLETGRVLLSERFEIARSPDGHGGMLKALAASGGLSDMASRGIQYIFYGQIDNPLLQVCHPALIGYHNLRRSEMTTQVIRKVDARQKVGNVVQVDGRTRIIEYSDLPDDCAAQVDDQGQLKLWAGNIAVHVFNREFLERAQNDARGLPFHRAVKKVPFLDDDGMLHQPESPNALKFERFIFDLLPLAERALVCEVAAADGFAALKNAPPAPRETAEWVRRRISDLHASWIRAAGGEVDEGVWVELSPFLTIDGRDLAGKLPKNFRLTASTYLESL
jgi:UDP-N-acetylglucosamine/UDP-N-acetylgalactosamine diphosphorylase